MNNSDASFDAGSSKQSYQHTYNLWKSSEFYNINNLSAYNLLGLDNPDHSFSVFSTPTIMPTPETTTADTNTPETSAPETSAPDTSAPDTSASEPSAPVISLAEPSTSFWDTEKPEPVRDSQNRRIISKVSLYEESVLREKKEDPVEEKEEVANDWTSEFWMKAGKEGDKKLKQKQPRKLPKNNIQKKLDVALSQPLKIDKAASMMAKMGWEGGALGKTGSGIVEPIAPNAVYATQTTGFGQPECADRRRPRKPQVQNAKQYEHQKKAKKLRVECFNTNLMVQTLTFVRNDYEIEVMFDSKLTGYERKKIHDFIDDIMHIEDVVAIPCDNEQQMELAIEIRKHNNYLLKTMSEGEMPERSLCLYKQPPDHMYLVTHSDLRDEPEEIADKNSTESAAVGNDEKAVETNEKPDGTVESNATAVEKEGGATANNDNAIMTDVDKVVEDAAKADDKEMTDVNQDPAKEETKKPQSKVFKLNLEGTKYECYMVKSKQMKSKRKKEQRERANNAKANKEKKVTKTNTKTTKFCRVTTNMLAKVDNPFLKSILSVQTESTNEPLTKNDLKNQILAYFTEFSKKKMYTQFKFLGAFEGIEIEAINEFINNVWMCLNDGDYMSDDILSVMREAKCGFEIKEDSNGSAVIYKIMKEELGT